MAWEWCCEELRFLVRWFRSLDAQLARGSIIFGELPASLLPPEPDILLPITTGFSTLDFMLQGGWPRGALHEISGPLGVGKSAFVWRSIEACVEAGGVVCYIDVDGGLHWLLPLPDGRKEAFVAECRVGEDVWDMIGALLAKDSVDLVVVDSVNALVPQEELDTSWGDFFGPWPRARWLGAALYQLQPLLRKSKAALICLRHTFALEEGYDTESSPGQALPLLADVRVALQEAVLHQEKDDRQGVGVYEAWLRKSPSGDSPRKFAL